MRHDTKFSARNAGVWGFLFAGMLTGLLVLAMTNGPAAFADEPAVAGRNASGKVVVEKATVERIGGVPRIIVNGQPIQARMFFSHWGRTGPTEVLRSQLRLAKQAGVQIVSFMSTHTNWYEPDGTYDWSRLDTLCDAILEENPDALLIPRLAVYAPGWWLKQHPNAKMEWIGRNPQQGSDVGWLRETVASTEYRQEACKVLATVIQHLEDKYGDHMLGYHPAGQNTDEWFMPNTWLKGYASYAADDLTAWRGWLKQKYGTDQALQQAWDDAAVTLETDNTLDLSDLQWVDYVDNVPVTYFLTDRSSGAIGLEADHLIGVAAGNTELGASVEPVDLNGDGIDEFIATRGILRVTVTEKPEKPLKSWHLMVLGAAPIVLGGVVFLLLWLRGRAASKERME